MLDALLWQLLDTGVGLIKADALGRCQSNAAQGAGVEVAAVWAESMDAKHVRKESDNRLGVLKIEMHRPAALRAGRLSAAQRRLEHLMIPGHQAIQSWFHAFHAPNDRQIAGLGVIPVRHLSGHGAVWAAQNEIAGCRVEPALVV